MHARPIDGLRLAEILLMIRVARVRVDVARPAASARHRPRAQRLLNRARHGGPPGAAREAIHPDEVAEAITCSVQLALLLEEGT